MKTLLKTTAVIAAITLASTAAAKAPSKGQMLTQCKDMIKAEFTDIKRIKLGNMKDRRGTFTAKFRVSADGERAAYTCTIAKDAEPLLVRTDKPATPEVAAGE